MKNLVILAGGKSRRMGSDKVFLGIHGETFLERLYKRGTAFFDNVYISTDTEEHAFEILRLPELKNIDNHHIITDQYPDCGPLGGIVSVFEKTDADRFAIVPTDVPLADMRVLDTLFQQCNGKPCIFRRDNGFLEPLIGVYDKNCLRVFKNCLEKQEYPIRKPLEINGFQTFSAEELIQRNPVLKEVNFASCFKNINNPEDYEELKNSSF